MSEIDLQGEVCPYTFLRTKLALEEMAAGEELAIVLDHPPAFRNVPQSLQEDGHQVLAVERRGALCVVRVRKAV